MNEVFITDIRNVQKSQRLIEKITPCGNIGVSIVGQSDIEILINTTVPPDKIKEIIDLNKKKKSNRVFMHNFIKNSRFYIVSLDM